MTQKEGSGFWPWISRVVPPGKHFGEVCSPVSAEPHLTLRWYSPTRTHTCMKSVHATAMQNVFYACCTFERETVLASYGHQPGCGRLACSLIMWTLGCYEVTDGCGLFTTTALRSWERELSMSDHACKSVAPPCPPTARLCPQNTLLALMAWLSPSRKKQDPRSAIQCKKPKLRIWNPTNPNSKNLHPRKLQPSRNAI